jgi:hypothetical protein
MNTIQSKAKTSTCPLYSATITSGGAMTNHINACTRNKEAEGNGRCLEANIVSLQCCLVFLHDSKQRPPEIPLQPPPVQQQTKPWENLAAQRALHAKTNPCAQFHHYQSQNAPHTEIISA